MEVAFIIWVLLVVFAPLFLRRAAADHKRRQQLERGPLGHTYREHRRVLPPGEGQPGGVVTFHAEADAFDFFRDELATDQDLALHDADTVVSMEPTDHGEVVLTSDVERPLPGPEASLEQEVDWEREHELFHQRYVDAREAAAPAVHTLLGDLRDDPQALRRAILLAEVLGPPVSQREG